MEPISEADENKAEQQHAAPAKVGRAGGLLSLLLQRPSQRPSRRHSVQQGDGGLRPAHAATLLQVPSGSPGAQPRRPGHRKRNSECFLSGEQSAAEQSPRKRLSVGPEYDSDFDVPLSPGGAPSEAKNAELRGKHLATEQRLRRRALWRAARQSQGDARHQFKKLVERNLEAYGYHTRTDSKSLPVVSFTRGRRREEALQSMDFQEFLKSDRGFAHFLKHVQSEFSDENLLFWRAVEEFRKDENPRTAIDIYERFVRVGAPHQVNLPHTIREAVDKVMDRWRGLSDELPPRPSRTFDAAQLEILKLMQRDSLPRFRAGDAWIRFMVDS